MIAIIRKGNGKYYTSLVFAYYSNTEHSEDDYQQYLNRLYNNYYIVLNESKTALIKQAVFDRNNKHLEPLILIADSSNEDWNVDENGNGCVDYLDYSTLLNSIENKTISDKIISRCILEDSKEKYKEYKTVNTQKELECLDCVSGNFHDAYIKDFRKENDSLYILFDGVWGCKIEIWFEGNVSYSTESRDPNKYDPYWSESSLIMNDGHFVLVDCYDVSEDELNEEYCWFKGNKLKYHVIPN